jgi:hypothetical protein
MLRVEAEGADALDAVRLIPRLLSDIPCVLRLVSGRCVSGMRCVLPFLQWAARHLRGFVRRSVIGSGSVNWYVPGGAMDKLWCVRIRVIVVLVLVFFAFLLMHAARTVKVWKDRGFHEKHENNDVCVREHLF